MKKSVVLSLSGGMDSSTLFMYYKHHGYDIIPVHFQYGSKHNKYEKQAMLTFCAYHNVTPIEIDATQIFIDIKSNLMLTGGAIPEGHYAAPTMALTVVPGRNTIFASILLGIAQSRGIDTIALGVHKGDAYIYPDCREDYIKALDALVHLASEGTVKVEAPFLFHTKADICKEGLKLKVPYQYTRTCYRDQELSCGKCGACNERLGSFAENNVVDPILYDTATLDEKLTKIVNEACVATTTLNVELPAMNIPGTVSSLLKTEGVSSSTMNTCEALNEKKEKAHRLIKQGMETILSGLNTLGLETDDPNFHGTPDRVARAYIEIFSGVPDTQKQVQAVLSTTFPCTASNMVVLQDIRVFSMCPHHFLPVDYVIDVAYIPSPGGKVLGISKLARLVDILAKRPVLQEQLVDDITEALMSLNGVQGAACVTHGQHYCMTMRGVKQDNVLTHLSSLKGVFLTEPETRAEWNSLLKK